MARHVLDKMRLGRWSGRSIAGYVDFVHRTSRVIVEPSDIEFFLAAHRPAIIAVWHGQFLLTPKVKPHHEPLAVMLARHGDAEHLAYALERFNTTLIRGAGAGARRKDRGGAHALRAALKTLDEGVFVAMTADVPPGPARRAGEGIIALARLSGRPIIPLAVATSRYHALPTWSCMTVNLPFGTLAGVFGDPIEVPRDADDARREELRLVVEEGLNRATMRAYSLAGADPRRTFPQPGQRGSRKEQASDGGAASTGDVVSARQPALGLGLKSYRLTTRLMQPAAPLLLGIRARRGKEDARRSDERLGIPGQPRPAGRLVWIHAASVGELNAILPLAAALREARSDLKFLITTGTVTSAALAADRLGPDDIHQYVPLDTPTCVSRFLDHWRPDLAVFTESEIWPNLVTETAQRSVPLALVNARMSVRSYNRWRRMKRVASPLFACFDVVLAQNETLAQRFSDMGVRRALSVGNLKIDSPPPPVEAVALGHLREALGERPLLVAASTHEGEELIIAEAHRQLARHHAGFCTLLAPRHPERGTEIAELLKSQGIGVAQRSLGSLPGDGTEIYIADTIGELGTFYSASPVAFVGGSLVNRGGQNPVEAIKHGAAVITGPNWQNFRDAYETLIAHHGAIVVHDADELSASVSRLLADNVEMQRMRTGAQSALSKLAGALERTVTELLRFLPEEKELRRVG